MTFEGSAVLIDAAHNYQAQLHWPGGHGKLRVLGDFSGPTAKVEVSALVGVHPVSATTIIASVTGSGPVEQWVDFWLPSCVISVLATAESTDTISTVSTLLVG